MGASVLGEEYVRISLASCQWAMRPAVTTLGDDYIILTCLEPRHSQCKFQGVFVRVEHSKAPLRHTHTHTHTHSLPPLPAPSTDGCQNENCATTRVVLYRPVYEPKAHNGGGAGWLKHVNGDRDWWRGKLLFAFQL
jgi:hypothetical protein